MERKKQKMMNLELLRCMAMMMVVVLHFLGKGKLLPNWETEAITTTGIVAWILEALSIVAVNVYMLISGYLLCESGFKWRRLVSLLLQIWFYSVAFGLLGVALGTASEEVTVYYLIQLIFPIFSEHYWFITSYVFLYLLLPFLNSGIQQMNKKQHGSFVLLFLGAFCFLKSILPVRLPMDKKGYDVLWYITLYLVASYIRRYGIPVLTTKLRGLLVYLAGVLLVLLELVVLTRGYAATGRLQSITRISFEYNHIFCFLASVGLFAFFLKVEVRGFAAKLAGFAGPLTLGVYLLHENLGFRYAWQNWLGADRVTGPGSLILYTLLAVVVVFIAGIAVEAIRKMIMKPIDKVITKFI